MKFLQRIRRKLLEEGNLKRYLIYASGEILLVMIGILLALQVNNWNEERKTHIQDLEFLNNLKVELAVDISSFKERKSYYQTINDNIKNTIQLFERGDSNLNQDEQKEIVSALSHFQMFSPVPKNINRNDLIIAQGTIDRIDKELNQKFLTYLQTTQEINSAIDKLGESLQQTEIRMIYPNVDYNYIDPNANKVDFNFEDISKKREVKNALQRSFGYREEYIDLLTDRIEDAENLINLINNNFEHIK